MYKIYIFVQCAPDPYEFFSRFSVSEAEIEYAAGIERLYERIGHFFRICLFMHGYRFQS